MHPFDFISPQNLEELYKVLDDPGGQIIAGGTDLLPKIYKQKTHPERIIDISRIRELDYIHEENGQINIGSLTSFSSIAKNPLLGKYVPSLVKAANHIGSPMTRQRATLGGNIVNASPAADSVPPLLIHDSIVTLASLRGERKLPLQQFLLSPGKTDLQPNEIVHHITIPKITPPLGSEFLKIGARQGMIIAIANAAVLIQLNGQIKIEVIRIALGAVAPTTIRCQMTEEFLVNQKPSPEIIQEAAKMILREITPISDLRGSESYRLKAASVLFQRCLLSSIEQQTRIG